MNEWKGLPAQECETRFYEAHSSIAVETVCVFIQLFIWAVSLRTPELLYLFTVW